MAEGQVGVIPEAPGESWWTVDEALKEGRGRFGGGSSLALLLARDRSVRNVHSAEPLTVQHILAWADRYQATHGKWPTASSGPIASVPNEKWSTVEAALRAGGRGLPGGSSLARLLTEQRGVVNRAALPRLSVKQILAWADACHRRTKQWPIQASGLIPESAGDTWLAVDSALRGGSRGLPGGSSLARLLAKRRGVRMHMTRPR